MSEQQHSFVRNTWYAAVWEHELDNSSNLLARKICDVPLVFYKTEDDGYAALDDRCCHRAAPLSMGRVEANCLRCMYHGILYDKSGTVVEIPGQAHISKNMKVRSYPVCAKGGMIWIWMGEAELADPNHIHDFPPLSDKANWRGFDKESYLHYQANWMLIVDNLADFTHVAFVHTNTLGGSESYAYESVPDEVEPLETGLAIKRWHKNSPPPPFHQRVIPQAEHNNKLDRLNDIEMHIPGVFLMKTSFDSAGADPQEGGDNNRREYRNCQYMTPETWNTTHFFWNYLHNFDMDNAATTASLKDSLFEGFMEDKVFIEEQQVLLEQSPDFVPRGISGDKALTVFRNKWRERLKTEAKNNPATAGPDSSQPVNIKALI